MNKIVSGLVIGLGALLMPAVAPAQVGALEGSVKLKTPQGLKPVSGAIVDIYRLDIRGHWEAKTDKSGQFVYLGLPLVGTYLVVASGSGLQPTWVNNVRLTQNPVVNIECEPGDGTRLTLDQVKSLIEGAKRGRQAQPQPSQEERAKLEAAQKEEAARRKEREELQAKLDQAISSFNQGIKLRNAKNYEAALSEFEAAASVDYTKDPAFVEVAHKANALVAETRYQIGADLFNQRKRTEAKPYFEEAVKAIKRAIAIAPTDQKNPNLKNDLLVYYDILVKNAKVLVEYYSATDLVDDTVKEIDRAAELDPANKNKWEIIKADLYRLAFRLDEAVAGYKGVLASDPNNIDALYGIGLALLSSSEKEKLQESANYLSEFVSKAPANDSRVASAKETIEALKRQFSIEAEKPATRRKGRP
jgi:tetratricopeptide (TPR) repeat protein